MKSSAKKWAEIAAPNSSSMKSKVSKFVDSAEQDADQSYKIEMFISRAEELGRKHKVDMYKLLSYMLAPLTDAKVEEPELETGIAGSVQNEEKTRPLLGKSREQVIAVCNRHGLRTLEQLLQLIDRIQQAQKGSLNVGGAD